MKKSSKIKENLILCILVCIYLILCSSAVFDFFPSLLFSTFPTIVNAQSIATSTTTDTCRIINKPKDCTCQNDKGLTSLNRGSCTDTASQSLEAFSLPESLRYYPNDLSITDTEFANTAVYQGKENSCATVKSITRINNDQYKIKLTTRLNGAGCLINIPWSVSPREIGAEHFGSDALETCNDTLQCDIMKTAYKPLKSASTENSKQGGLKINFDPPIYRIPLTSNHESEKERSVPFGYTGYYTYDKKTKGSCGLYGLQSMLKGGSGSYLNRKISELGVALHAPDQINSCRGSTPTEQSFASNFTARVVADRVSTLYRSPLSINNPWLRSEYAAVLTNNQVFTGSPSSSRRPFAYTNVVDLLGIRDPFYCGENNRTRDIVPDSGSNSSIPVYEPDDFKWSIGGDIRDLHSCPMTESEWNALIPDVALLDVNVDELFKVTSGESNNKIYDVIEQTGTWNIPRNLATSSLPLGVYRCSRAPNVASAGSAIATNYASVRYPITMSFGPNCAVLQTLDAENLLRTAIGGYIGIVSSEDQSLPGAHQFIQSTALPVRYAKSFGTTIRNSNGLNAPYSTKIPGVMEMKAEILSGTSGIDALNVNPNVLRYILCNGGAATPFNGGINHTTSERYGPLMSNSSSSSSSSKEGEIWPNPFRAVAELSNKDDTDGMIKPTECEGCTFPTLSHQKGFSIMSTEMWKRSAGEECGKYHMDHTLWSRILALVNETLGFSSSVAEDNNYVDTELYRIFALWNSSEALISSFSTLAESLRYDKVSESLPQLSTERGMHGIGARRWLSKIADGLKHGCRPQPEFQTSSSTDASAIPLCALLKQQLYAQSAARLKANGTTDALGSGFSQSVPDLDSAQNTGMFNRVAPNIWFGLVTGEDESIWHLFFDDSFDRPHSLNKSRISSTGPKGLTNDVTMDIELIIERSSMLEFDYQKQVLHTLSVNESACLSQLRESTTYRDQDNDYATTLWQSYQTFMSFLAGSVGVQYLELKFTPINIVGASLVYDLDSIVINTNPHHLLLNEALLDAKLVFNDDILADELIIQLKYDTINTNVTYDIVFEFAAPIKQDASDKRIGFSVSLSYAQLLIPSDPSYGSDQITLISLENLESQYCDGILYNMRENENYYYAYDFSQVKAPSNLPYNYYCASFFDTTAVSSEYLTSLISVLPNRDQNLIYESDLNEKRNVAFVNSNATALVTWRCVSYSKWHTPNKFRYCNVSGDGTHRTGDCLDFEDYLGQCNEWWDLTCQPYNQQQITFLFCLFTLTPLIFGLIFALLWSIKRNKDLQALSQQKK